jgi:hypothetical protein
MGSTDQDGPSSGDGGQGVPRSQIAAAWFLRACAVLDAGIWTLMFVRSRPTNWLAFGGLGGILLVVMTLVMSFMFLKTGRARMILAAITIVLGIVNIVFAVASLAVGPP